VNRIEPIVRTAKLDVRYTGKTITLSWDTSGFVLQSASEPDGSWTDIEGTVGSPFTVEPSHESRFYRLRK